MFENLKQGVVLVFFQRSDHHVYKILSNEFVITAVVVVTQAQRLHYCPWCDGIAFGKVIEKTKRNNFLVFI